MDRHSQSISDRLRSFGQSRFGSEHGWKTQFAEALGISSQHLDRYLSGSAEPGKKMYLRLIDLGCDVRWLLTGATSDAVRARELTKGEEELLAELKSAGINRAEQVRYILDPEGLAADIAEAAAKEIKTRYKTSKRPRRRKA